MIEKPAFIQGLFGYEGKGLESPSTFNAPVFYLVPPDRRAQTIYFRSGNAAPEMIYLVLANGGKPMRYFPVGAKGAIHVPLAVIEDIAPGSEVEILIAAPKGLNSFVLVDVGFMEIA